MSTRLRKTTAATALQCAAALLVVWLLVNPRTPDLAAQVYRVGLFQRAGFSVWDTGWYGGHHLPGYSLLFPPLASLLGMRLVAALSVLASAALFERIVVQAYGARARWGAVWFAGAAVGDVWAGRLTFALGVAFALAAVLAYSRGRIWVAALAAVLCAASSPVAGVLLCLAVFTHALAGASARRAAALLAPVLVLVAALALAFPEGGWEPFPVASLLATLAVVFGFSWVLHDRRKNTPATRLLQVGAVLYALACVLSVVVHTPMGSNVERYAVLLAGPLLVCVLPEGDGSRSAGMNAAVARRAATLVVLAGMAVWVVWGPVRETLVVSGNASTQAAYYTPVKRFLATHGGRLQRVEVPLTRGHWEAALLAPSVSLARGWEKQLEDKYDGVLLDGQMNADGYRRWLQNQAISYVALPDVQLDPSSAREGQLIRAGLPYLRRAFSSRHWVVYRVLDSTPLLRGPARLTALGSGSFSVLASAAGRSVVRVHYTRYWQITAGTGCVRRAPGGWTELSVSAPGVVSVQARFSLRAALGREHVCRLARSTSQHTRADRVGAADTGSSDYRWLVATSGAPPSIARENRARGTRAWRLPGPARLLGGEASGDVAGYVAAQAIAPGQTQRVYVSAPHAHTVTAQVFRMGWYGGTGGRLVLQSKPLPVVRQPRCAHRVSTGLTECDWHPTLSFQIPSALTSGVYVVKLRASDGAQRDCLFVVRAARSTPLLVEIPTASYEAYNAWGGDSLYPGGSKLVRATGTDQGVEVSYDRPYDSQTGAGQFFIREVAMVRFLERYGYPVSYTTIESIDGDPAQVGGVRGLLDVGHSEYWSERDEHAFAQARDHGTNLIFISSDTMAWRVRFGPATRASSQAGVPDHVIVAYKESVSRDPDRAQPSGLFPRGGADLMGSAYNGCITPRIPGTGPPVYHYYAWAPAPGLRPRWLFAGAGIDATTRIPGIVGYELDQRTQDSPRGAQLVGQGSGVPCLSEHEPSPAHGVVADTTLYTAPSGALVFATGTLGWEYALSPVPQASPDAPAAPDARVVRMTRNLLARVLSRPG